MNRIKKVIRRRRRQRRNKEEEKEVGENERKKGEVGKRR